MRFIVVHKLIASLLALLLVGCSFNVPDWSPEAVALRDLRADPHLELVEIVATRRWERGRVVLYRGIMQTGLHPGEGELVFGHIILQREGLGWRFIGGGSGSAGSAGPAGRRISYMYSSGSSIEHGSHSSVIGEVLTPEIEAVEIVFDDGRRLRDETEGDVFAFTVTGSVAPCALFLLDGENQLVGHIGPRKCDE